MMRKYLTAIAFALCVVTLTSYSCTTKGADSNKNLNDADSSEQSRGERKNKVESVKNAEYTKSDSTKVVSLLASGAKEIQKNPSANLMIYYGHQLKGVPYVAHTLESKGPEHLMVNMRQMDCTTFVENVLALTLTTKEGKMDFADFLRNLQRVRYDCGKIDGYPSRNHYFVWWAESNIKQGIISSPIDDDATKTNFLQKQYIDLNWMTTHSDAYSMLKGKTDYINRIKDHEMATRGHVMYYIPQSSLGLSKQQMRYVQDGDILAIATNKKGLDTTHIGIAEWGSDGKLHLLNASQIHKKVILENLTLKDYMAQHKVQIGVWVFRVR